MLSLGILSWRAHKTLRQTLETYAPLLPLVDEAVVFFNGFIEGDVELAQEFGFTPMGTPENHGIMGGTANMVKALKGDRLLLSQNDCPICVPPEVVKQRLEEAMRAIDQGKTQYVQLHARLSDGTTYDHKFRKFYPSEGEQDTFKRKMMRLLRPCLASRFRGRAQWSLEAPEKVFPEVYTREGSLLFTNSRFVNFCEQPHLATRAFLEPLYDYCFARKAKKHTTEGGQSAFEIILNGPWWRRQEIPLAISDGIFAHERVDDSFRASNGNFNPEMLSGGTH